MVHSTMKQMVELKLTMMRMMMMKETMSGVVMMTMTTNDDKRNDDEGDGSECGNDQDDYDLRQYDDGTNYDVDGTNYDDDGTNYDDDGTNYDDDGTNYDDERNDDDEGDGSECGNDQDDYDLRQYDDGTNYDDETDEDEGDNECGNDQDDHQTGVLINTCNFDACSYTYCQYCIGDQLLYEGSAINTATSWYAMMHYAVSNRLSYKAIKDLITLMKV